MEIRHPMGLRHYVRTQHLEVARYMDIADLSLFKYSLISTRLFPKETGHIIEPSNLINEACPTI